jgi:integrase
MLSILCAWGCERGLVRTNPAEKVKNIRRQRGAPDANRPWSDEERDAVLGRAPSHMLPALALMMFTGLGPKDALRLPRSQFRSGEIATQRSRTGEPVFWPAPAALRRIVELAPAHNSLTLCANSNGLPWTESGFRASWRKFRIGVEREGLVGPGLTLYGLRHTVAVILREAGADERAIADALGQKTIEMARHYSRGADLKRKMRGIVADFDREVNRRRTETVKPGQPNCQTGSLRQLEEKK